MFGKVFLTLILYMKIYTSLVKMRKQFAFNFLKNMSVDIKNSNYNMWQMVGIDVHWNCMFLFKMG